MSEITEIFTLPSRGVIYKHPINPQIKLRMMTTEDELKRNAPSTLQYKPMCDLIESCIVDNQLGMSVYDLCFGDYEFLLHKLRVVSYGSDYNVAVKCPVCGHLEEFTFNLDDLKVKEFDPALVEALTTIDLPFSKDVITIKMITPRILDELVEKRKQMLEKSKNTIDPTILLEPLLLVDTVNGKILNELEKETYLRRLTMKDMNKLSQSISALSDIVGIENTMKIKCSKCGFEYVSPFRYTSEFFRPTIY